MPSAHLPVVVGASAGDDVAQVATRSAADLAQVEEEHVRRLHEPAGSGQFRSDREQLVPRAGEDEHDVELGQLRMPASCRARSSMKPTALPRTGPRSRARSVSVLTIASASAAPRANTASGARPGSSRRR